MDTSYEYMLEGTSGRKNLSTHHQFVLQIGILSSWTEDADQPSKTIIQLASKGHT